jgi:hypothetical protein
VVTCGVLAAIALAVGLRLRRAPATLNTQRAGLVDRAAIALSFAGLEGRVRLSDSD